jgi:hypothetical protein
MAELLGLTGSGLAFGTLLVTGTGHLRHRRTLVAHLGQQGLIPRRGRELVAGAIGPSELLAGSLGVVALSGGGRMVLAAAPAFVLYACYTGFAAALWRRRPGTPCGCTARDEPTSGWTVLRAGLLALVTAALLATDTRWAQWTWPTGAASLLIAVALGLVIWQLPMAMRSPGPVAAPPGGSPGGRP